VDTTRVDVLKQLFQSVSSTQVMFMDAISHVARITRVLRQPKGNMLLLGVGGSGRQSLSRLSTFMAECKIFSIEITKGYGLSEWC
jgi:dynein heavy chain